VNFLDANLQGIDLTTPMSVSTVVICKKPNGFLVTFPKDSTLWKNVKNIPGSLWGEESPFPYMFFVPRNQFDNLKTALGTSAFWRSKSELENDQLSLQKGQEKIQDVLNRIPKDVDLPGLKISPYSFQKLAVSWAVEEKGEEKVIGGLLADQMGLGKTLEGIATASFLKGRGDIKNCLIVCPATLKTQWQQEIERFTDETSIIIKSSAKGYESRKKLYERIKEEKPFFTIINYELLIQKEVVGKVDLKKKKGEEKVKSKKIFGDYLDLTQLKEIGYDMVILDEAHKIKNPDTKMAGSVREIEAKYKLLMTGTPIEKELKNIFQLFDYISPKILSINPELPFEERRKQFDEQFLLKRLNPFSYPARVIDVFGEKNTNELRTKINPFMLRRLTEDVSDEMPDQIEQKITVDFADFQFDMYDKVSKEMREAKKAIQSAKSDEDREMLENHFKGLAQMRTIICDSPSVLLESNSMIAKKIVGKKTKFPTIPKVERLLELVEEICFDNDKKVVIFTRYSRVANFLKREIDKVLAKKAKELKQDVVRNFIYEGDTKQGCKLRDVLEKKDEDKSKATCFECPFYDKCETRTKYAWHFQNDPKTKIIIATDAANFGVNLQKGKYLINYDLPDSFSIYLQRNGRIRRLGSEHDKVFIYNLVTREGVDEKKLTELQKQMKINDKIIENNQSEVDAIKNADNAINDLINDI
jgi:SNF2 family DNA or RNA helicase